MRSDCLLTKLLRLTWVPCFREPDVKDGCTIVDMMEDRKVNWRELTMEEELPNEG